jgi:hypothetical protein
VSECLKQINKTEEEEEEEEERKSEFEQRKTKSTL